MFFDGDQLLAAVLAVLVALSACAAIVFHRSSRRWSYVLLCLAASLAMTSWFEFGRLRSVYVDVDSSDTSRSRRKEERHQPFHLHEFFHYYLGAKYFRENGYLALYECTALADKEIAEEEGVPPRIGGYVRDLGDVLRDKPYEQALDDCRAHSAFSPARWASFKSDLRELQRLVPDDWWQGAVYDAGFNPPPSWILVGSAVANVIPIRLAGAPTYLVATSLDMVLLLVCFVALRRSFGRTTAVVAAIFFGASFIASYGWNGGAFLRFTWITSLVLALAAMRRGRWVVAGALLGASIGDRVFPAGFAMGAMVPVAWAAWRSPEQRRILLRFGAGLGGVAVFLALASAIAFGASSWSVFFSRILRHGDIYYVMHIGLKKVLTYRSWVPHQNFNGHDGLMRFRSWNLRLRVVWAEMRPIALPIQLLSALAAAAASVRRRPYEAALLCGVAFMFLFNMGANYYFAVLALVPAFLLRAAATAPSSGRRVVGYYGLVAFGAFWMLTLIASRVWDVDIIYDWAICIGLAAFLAVWIAVWIEPRELIAGLRSFRR